MISSQIVPSEVDAKRLLSFIDVLAKYSSQDMEEGKMVLGEIADNYNAEKAAIAILSILSANNFEYLITSWKNLAKWAALDLETRQGLNGGLPKSSQLAEIIEVVNNIVSSFKSSNY